MRSMLDPFKKVLLLMVLIAVTGCMNDDVEVPVTVIPPTPTMEMLPTSEIISGGNERDFFVIATDAPNPNFTDFDKFGNVIGFNNDLMARLSAVADFDYEFVVTPHEGVLESMAAQSTKDFDAVMSALIIPDEPQEGITYTKPYLEVGQVLVVLADEQEVQSYRDIQQGKVVGVLANSSGKQTAQDFIGVADRDLFEYESPIGLLQALIDGLVDVAILDSFTAEHFARAFPEQLKIAGGEGRSAWISSKGYGIAVAADNTELIERLNQAITQAQNDLTVERLTVAWLIPQESIKAGESRVPTPASELIVGIVGQLESMDPASDPDLISWEVKNNTMSGLYSLSPENEIIPMLAESLPEISEDKLEYTIRLRRGLRFTDGRELSANEVKWSIDRSAILGNFLVNSYLKNSDEDGFADIDAVQAIDQYTIKIILQEPTAYFLSLLATPPYFPVSDSCYADTWDLKSTCGGIGPYTVVSWEPDRIRLKANPEWPGRPAPAFENIHVRLYENSDVLLRSLVDFQSIDVAWTGLPFSDFIELQSTDLDGDGIVDFKSWEGPAVFKSYLIFDQAVSPWDSGNIRQAVAYALDRASLAGEVFQNHRIPLFSPIPDQIPGHLAVLPQRDLVQARALLNTEGYNQTNPLPITLWYTNDGHYTLLEEAYAVAIKTQLEETGIFEVTLQGVPWEIYRPQVSQCGYSAYLLGWPTPGQPTNYFDVTSWTDYFIQSSSSGFCSNYDNETMAQLIADANEEIDPAARLELYAQIQRLWAEDLPTLDLTQEVRQAISLNQVDNIRIDGMGLMHYEVLTKGGG